MKYPNAINNLIEAFKKYPGIGKKTAERLALYSITKLNNEDINQFSQYLHDIEKLKRCKICGNISETDICNICNDEKRNQKIIMVVEDIKDIIAVEKTEVYNGAYHVLEGVINFSSGIGTEELNLEKLFERIENIDEVILATNASIEGEITSQYIYEMLKDKECLVSRIAHGIPVGGDLEYADTLTLVKALEGRRNLINK